MFEIRDAMTFVPVMATLLSSADEREAYLLRRTGYVQPSILLCRLTDHETKFVPTLWDTRTMSVAHRHIEKNFDTLQTGDVVDVQYILGLSPVPKSSERDDL